MVNTNGLQTHPNETTALERIRPELNLEKWSIFAPAHSRNKKARTLSRTVTLPDGSTRTSRVSVDATERLGTLTTEDQKTYYALIKIWEEKGRPTDNTSFSIRGVAKIRGRRWGQRALNETVNELRRLSGIPTEWYDSFFNKETGETVEVLESFHILENLKIALKRRGDKIANKEVGYFKFNDFILKNLLTNHTKPVFIEIVIGFTSEIAQLLYTHLDLMMARRNYYERKTRELFFDDLGLQGEIEYKYPSGRKRKLEKALKELRGIPLSTGTLTTAKIEKTKDGKDYKVVFEKNGQLELPSVIEAVAETNGSRGEGTAPPDVHPIDDRLTAQARELVNHFHHVFHGVTNNHISSKAISQAVTLIAQYGMDQARHIVDFAHHAAQETHFKPAAFGAVIQYVSRALADYEQAQLREKQNIALTQCEFCDKHGFLTFEDTNKTISVGKCPHDPERIHAFTQSRGVQLLRVS